MFRWVSFFMLLSILHVSGAAFSQGTISISQKNVTIRQALEEIEQKTNFKFLYRNENIDVNKVISLDIENGNIETILKAIFSDCDFSYLVFENNVIALNIGNSRQNAGNMQQNHKVTGKVTDSSGAPLPGVTVVIKGTSQGTITDTNGDYSLFNVPNNAVLVFSFVGMKTQEIAVSGKTNINISLVEETIGLEEVVAIGYGTMKKSDLTGSIASIKEDNINLQAVRSPLQALTGLSSGIQVLQNSGAPGGSLSVLIRGGNSLSGGNEPLYVIDGFPGYGLDNINPNDIISIEILKDASATAIYGSRGANGVVLVTTKEGKTGKTTVEYNGYYGIQKISKMLDMLNAREFGSLANVRAANDGLDPYFSDSEIASFGEGTNWQDEIFRIAPIQNHTINVSGGSEKTIFSVSGNYFTQEGILINSDHERFQLKTNFQHKINPNWIISLNNILSRTTTNNLYSDNTTRGYGVLSAALTAPPTLSVYDEEGGYTDARAYVFSESTAENPVALALEQKDQDTQNSCLTNISVEGKLFKNFVLKSSVGVAYNNSRNDYYSSTELVKSSSGDASISYSENTHIVNENTLSFSKEINVNHKFTIMGGITAEKSISRSVVASSSGFLTDLLENNSLQSGSALGTPTSSYSDYTMLSYLGRINYSYKGKYLITSSIRADGSSRFGENNKWGYFPSAAIAWRVSEEDFWNNFDKISNLKIRGSWGKTGNTAISPYKSLSTLSSVQIVFDDDLYIGYAPGSTQANPNLKWETTKQIDVGMDIGFFGNKLSFTVDYYHKETSDLLSSVTLSPNTGYTTMLANIGSIQNKGLEVSSNLKFVKGSFNWDLGANISVNRNKVLSLSQGADVFGSKIGLPLQANTNLAREGYPVGVFYGYKEDGLTENGEIKFVDYDDSGDINTLDRVIIGDPNPDYIFGINSFMSYNNFGLSILVEGVQGNDIFNATNTYVADGFTFGMNNIKDVLGNYWTEENPDLNAKYPRISSNTDYEASDRYIEDGSYIKIKSVQLSYTLKGGKFESSYLTGSQIYLGIQNLVTFTNYSGYSPEVNTLGGGISKGVDQTGYPVARIFMLGFKIKL